MPFYSQVEDRSSRLTGAVVCVGWPAVTASLSIVSLCVDTMSLFTSRSGAMCMAVILLVLGGVSSVRFDGSMSPNLTMQKGENDDSTIPHSGRQANAKQGGDQFTRARPRRATNLFMQLRLKPGKRLQENLYLQAINSHTPVSTARRCCPTLKL